MSTGNLFGGGQSDQQRLQQGYSTGMATWSPGLDYGHLDPGASNLNRGTIAGYQDAEFNYGKQLQLDNMWASFFEGFGQPAEPTGPSYEDQLADQKALYDKQLADQQRIQGLNDRDTLFGSYMDAAGTATDFISGEIDKERSNAALLGIDYEVTDEQKGSRISDYFATVWGEGDQTRLEGLIKQWGKPTGFTGFSVARGNGGAYSGVETSNETLATSQGLKPKTLASEDDEQPLGA